MGQRPQSIIFRNMQAPGDIMMMTAAIRDLHRCYPGKFITGVETTAKEVWENNPYIKNLTRKQARVLPVGYPLIHQSNQTGLHFIQGFLHDINKKLNLNVRLTEFRADLHWSDAELQNPLVEGDYWVILSGGKADFTTKWWDVARYQQVVDELKGEVNFVQIGNKPSGGGARHYHPALNNVVNLVGKTNLREAFRVCLHAKGFVVPVTCFMHLAAALGKPAVVVAGGREHYTWEAYVEETLKRNMAFASGLVKKTPGTKAIWESWNPYNDPKFVNHPFVPHTYFHSIGQLKCCSNHGCWKTKVTEGKPKQNCKDVVRRPGCVPLPKCMDMVTAEQVIKAVRDYETFLNVERTMATSVHDLIVKVDKAEEPPPKQDACPIIAPKQAPATPKPVKNIKGPVTAKEIPDSHLSFPITICGLTYGDYGHLALRCLNSIYSNLDASLFKLRYAFNEVSERSKKSVISFLEDKPNVERVYEADPQVYKYPMMRRMFHDPDAPITTDWIMWFDDDSHVLDRNWIIDLAHGVNQKFLDQTKDYPKGYHMFGKVYYFHLRGNQWEWMKKADWYTGRKPRVDMSKKPPQDKSDFCTGGYWVVTREAVQATNWPDARLRHRGGDVWMGAALHQQGYGVAQVNKGVKISDAKLRGYNEAIAGTE